LAGFLVSWLPPPQEASTKAVSISATMMRLTTHLLSE